MAYAAHFYTAVVGWTYSILNLVDTALCACIASSMVDTWVAI